jgi:F0F1-type ATP synthase assembly protein I
LPAAIIFIISFYFALIVWPAALAELLAIIGVLSTFLPVWIHFLSAWPFAKGAQTLCAVSFYSGGIIE